MTNLDGSTEEFGQTQSQADFFSHFPLRTIPGAL